MLKALRRNCTEANVILDDLEHEHVRGGKELANLRESLEAYERNDPGGFDRFRECTLAFSDFQTLSK